MAAADTAFDAPGNANPLVPGYFADPTIRKFGDTYYLYATTDGNGGGRGPSTVWVSKDFTNWVLVPMNWPTTPYYWAPDVIRRPDGKYYLFYSQPCSTFGGVADSPVGPWKPLVPGDGLITPDRLVKEVITLDHQFFEDRDGTLYAYWGTWGIFANSGCGWGVVNPDMKSFSRLGMIPNTQAKDFFEAPFMIERNGVYYFTYSSGSCHDGSYRVQYAVGDRPDGQFTMGPNNPILSTTKDGRVDGPGHHSILQEGDSYYMIYHRHDIPVTPNGMHRQLCADRMVFGKDGEILKVEPTHKGIGALQTPAARVNLLAGKPVTASHYRDTLRNHEYKPEYAVDDNNATLWRPADNRPGQALTVDLGKPTRIRRVETQFEYATWYYQYVLETSLDGTQWTAFADRRANTRWGSPMVDDGDVEARYLRLTTTGTEFPGSMGAVWNIKAFAEAVPDPLHALADRGFAVAKRPEYTAVTAGGGDQAPARPAGSAPELLIDLDASVLEPGVAVAEWANRGKLGGVFRAGDDKPTVGMASGCKAVRFNGAQMLTADQPSPRRLAGNSSYTFAAWVNNPEIAESECLLSWAGRGGPDGATAQFGYGSHPEFGAVGHWGFADMGFRGAPPAAGRWHHLAVVFDGVIERLYVNGELVNSEAKMLLMHQGRPIRVGASEPGSEGFDGYIASLRLYDGALDAAAVKQLAAEAPSADVAVHLDSGKLDYGPLDGWHNEGALGGSFAAKGAAPEVADVHGRVAVRFKEGQSLELAATPAITAGATILLGYVIDGGADRADVLDLSTADGGKAAVGLPGGSGWRFLALSYGADGKAVAMVDGKPYGGPLPALAAGIKGVRLGGGFDGAVARFQLFRRAMATEELARMHALWRAEWPGTPWQAPGFALVPTALSPTMVAVAGKPGEGGKGPFEYRFAETTGGKGGERGAWSARSFLLDDELEPDTRYAYAFKVRDPLGNVTPPSQAVEVVTDPGAFVVAADDFNKERNLLESGVEGSVWDGILGQADQSQPEAIIAGGGSLRLQSKGTVWDGGRPLGPFLFKKVSGDFVAELEVADYAGLKDRQVPGNNDGGLMVRVAEGADAGPGDDFIQLNFFPIWSQGNVVSNMDGGRSQKGNKLAWDAHRHLQIVRHGNRFHLRTRADDGAWTEMPGSPVERPDMDGLPLQVGPFHASYGAGSSFISFRSFRLITRR